MKLNEQELKVLMLSRCDALRVALERFTVSHPDEQIKKSLESIGWHISRLRETADELEGFVEELLGGKE